MCDVIKQLFLFKEGREPFFFVLRKKVFFIQINGSVYFIRLHFFHLLSSSGYELRACWEM